MNKRIERLRGLKIESPQDKIQLDNLDLAWLVNVNGEVKVENEHGTVFELDELSESEIEVFEIEYSLPTLYDYVILNENNEWISYGNEASDEEILNDVNYNKKTGIELRVIKAKKFIEETF